ncbi:SCO4225 family membrane protein [Streptomyces sp. NPDC051578]|uniref:SCO4225 family membrane protein n=1 Tax=Streptomyces sp. NPDC051578 TaxID=3365662 RepID=UPI0037B99342
MKMLETTGLAWREPVSRVYLAILAVCALWAVTGGIGLGEEWRLPRIFAVILTMPWILLVHLFLVVTQIDSLLLGYSFYFESPAWLFEPFFIAYCLAAGLLNAHLLGRWTRSSKRSWPVPVGAVGFFAAAFAIWRL